MPQQDAPETNAAGKIILATIRRQGLKRSQIARAMGIDNRFMYEIVSGKRPIPVSRINRLCEALRLTKRQSDELIAADTRARVSRSRPRQGTEVRPEP